MQLDIGTKVLNCIVLGLADVNKKEKYQVTLNQFILPSI